MKKLVQPVTAAPDVDPCSSHSSAVVDPTGPCSETVAAAFSSDTTGHTKKEINQICGEGSSKESQPTSGDDSENVLEIKVLDSKYNKIECKIEEIQQKTNTFVVINLDDVDLANISHFCTVNISGNVKNCKEAEVIIHKIVSEGKTRSINIWARTSILSRRIVKIRLFILGRDYHVRVDVTNIIRRDRTKVILTGLDEDIDSVSDYIDSLYKALISSS